MICVESPKEVLIDFAPQIGLSVLVNPIREDFAQRKPIWLKKDLGESCA